MFVFVMTFLTKASNLYYEDCAIVSRRHWTDDYLQRILRIGVFVQNRPESWSSFICASSVYTTTIMYLLAWPFNAKMNIHKYLSFRKDPCLPVFKTDNCRDMAEVKSDQMLYTLKHPNSVIADYIWLVVTMSSNAVRYCKRS